MLEKVAAERASVRGASAEQLLWRILSLLAQNDGRLIPATPTPEKDLKVKNSNAAAGKSLAYHCSSTKPLFPHLNQIMRAKLL